MPIHDWTRVDAGIFHDFHLAWIFEIKRALNRGVLPPVDYALAEQIACGFDPEVVTLQQAAASQPFRVSQRGDGTAGVMLADAPPQVAFHVVDESNWYVRKANAIVIHHVSDHRVVAVIGIVSPGSVSDLSGELPQTFIEPLRIGGSLTPMPLFLTADQYVLVPLEATYHAAFDSVPEIWRTQLAPQRGVAKPMWGWQNDETRIANEARMTKSAA